MSNYSTTTSTSETFGSTALMGAVIALTILLGFAFLADTSPDMGAKAAAHAQVQTVADAGDVQNG